MSTGNRLTTPTGGVIRYDQWVHIRTDPARQRHGEATASGGVEAAP